MVKTQHFTTGAQVQSLVGELRYNKLGSTTKKKIKPTRVRMTQHTLQIGLLLQKPRKSHLNRNHGIHLEPQLKDSTSCFYLHFSLLTYARHSKQMISLNHHSNPLLPVLQMNNQGSERVRNVSTVIQPLNISASPGATSA